MENPELHGKNKKHALLSATRIRNTHFYQPRGLELYLLVKTLHHLELLSYSRKTGLKPRIKQMSELKAPVPFVWYARLRTQKERKGSPTKVDVLLVV